MLFKKREKAAVGTGKQEEGTEVKPVVRIADHWEQSQEKYAPGVLVEVTNGKGILREEMVYTKDTSHLILMFGNQPLVQLQGDENFCPTCEKILKSAYGLEQSEEFRRRIDGLNHTEDFGELVESIQPVLELLKDGSYILLDTKLYPTDGNGHLFWNVPNLNCAMSGTCIYYYGNCEWGNCRPYFTVASQPYGKLDNSRVDYYMMHPQGRVLAYYMDGYMTALIDGHHKAMAAAKLHKMVEALVIIPCYPIRYRNENGSWVECIGNGEFSWNCSEYGLRYMRADSGNEKLNATEISFSYFNDFPESVNREMCELAAYYPDVHSVAGIDLIGELTQERLNNIIDHKEIVEPDQIIYFLKVMIVLKHRRTVELFDFFMHESIYCQQRYSMVKEIVRLNEDGTLTDYLIEVMVEFEDEYPEIKDLILDYV